MVWAKWVILKQSPTLAPRVAHFPHIWFQVRPSNLENVPGPVSSALTSNLLQNNTVLHQTNLSFPIYLCLCAQNITPVPCFMGTYPWVPVCACVFRGGGGRVPCPPPNKKVDPCMDIYIFIIGVIVRTHIQKGGWYRHILKIRSNRIL